MLSYCYLSETNQKLPFISRLNRESNRSQVRWGEPSFPSLEDVPGAVKDTHIKWPDFNDRITLGRALIRNISDWRKLIVVETFHLLLELLKPFRKVYARGRLCEKNATGMPKPVSRFLTTLEKRHVSLLSCSKEGHNDEHLQTKRLK